LELTDRQRQVLRLIAAGKTNAEIGEALGISLDGAKWHVSEILARLDVQTREEAAEIWRRERGIRRGAGRLMRAFRPATALGSVALSGAVLAGIVVGVVIVLDRRTDDPQQTAAVVVPPPTPSLTATPEPTPVASPSSVVPDGPVAFAVCGEVTGYRKLTLAEMRDVFTNKRFGDGVKPGPFYWSIYQSHYYWIVEPHAISANVENVALSAGTATGGGTASGGQLPGCRTPDERQTASFQALWLYDHHVVSMRASSSVLIVEVESRPGSYEWVEFPDPAPPRLTPPNKNDGPLFTGVRIVDAAGHMLASRGAGANGWEFDDRGALVAGTLSSSGSPGTLNLRVAVDLEITCDQQPRGPTNVTFTPARGAPRTARAAACSNAWEVAASVHLDPGDWTVEVDGQAYYTVLPKDGPRP
jgi:DNA-binding CsgD family transcriptional regulator